MRYVKNCQEIYQIMQPCFFVKENWVRSILFVSPTSEPVLVLQMFAWGSAKRIKYERSAETTMRI